MTRVNLLLLCVLVACALSLVTSRHEARRLYVELERERSQARQFDVEFGQLSLEQSTWAMPARVEKIARESLHMQLPMPSRVQVIESPIAPAKTPTSTPVEASAVAELSNEAASAGAQ
jgi:cell division protein FtsL